jgi:hypothetical protein
MKLPDLSHADRYRGLYVFDFGEWTAVGYTADEIAVLLESEAYRAGKVYKIVRATPDGQMELRGVSPARFQLESGTLFNRNDRAAAEADFAELVRLADQHAVPCRAFVHLADRGPQVATGDALRQAGVARYVTALVYPAEYEDEMARWLDAVRFGGGDLAEAGPSHVSNYYATEQKILQRQQLWSQTAIPSRSADEVLATVRQAVQRQLSALAG